MRRLTWLFTTVILFISLLAALPAAAQGSCPGVCIGYSSPTAVPLSPMLTMLIAVVLAGSGYFFLRRKNHGFLAVVLAGALGIFTMAMNIRESIAVSLYQVLLAAGNYAEVTLPAGFTGPVDVRNPQSFPVVVTSITVGSGFVIDPSSTLTVGTQIPAWATVNSAVVIAAPVDTTPPTQTSSLNLGTFTLGNSLNQTVTFDEAIATATLSGLPTGVSGSTSISGSSVTVTLNVNPTTFTFSSATQSIPFTLTVTDAATNARANSETASVNDVAPNFAAQVNVTEWDRAGWLPIFPITNICPTGNDQFGRSITCTATVTFVSGGIVTGWITFSSWSNSIGGTIDVDQTTVFQVWRTVKAVNGAAQEITNSTLTLTDEG